MNILQEAMTTLDILDSEFIYEKWAKIIREAYIK